MGRRVEGKSREGRWGQWSGCRRDIEKISLLHWPPLSLPLPLYNKSEHVLSEFSQRLSKWIERASSDGTKTRGIIDIKTRKFIERFRGT
jgi:hypothetical protein